MNIIFDFDGTIADSFRDILGIFETLSHAKEPISEAKIQQLRDYPLPQVVRALGIRPWRIPLMLIRGRKLMTARMPHIRPFPGLPEALHELAARGHQLFILSTNSPTNIHQFLQQYDLADCISGVEGGVGLQGKARSLRAFMKKRGLAPESCRYVGDETRDIIAARAAGVSCVAVAWGFNSAKALAEFQPDQIAQTPPDLPAAFADK